jgi:hypothetical protein
MDIGVYLVRRGLITADDYVDAREAMAKGRHRIGELALTSHKLTMRQVMSILDVQVDTPRPFGQLAVEKGYLNQSDVMGLLEMQNKMSPSLVEVLVKQKILDEDTLREEGRRFQAEIVEDSMVVHQR